MSIEPRLWRNACAFGIVSALTAWALSASAADLPAATRKMLAELKTDASALGNLDKELAVPKSWVDAAAKEGAVKIAGTWQAPNFARMIAPFRERYPGVRIDYIQASRYDRVIKPLMALSANRVISDVISGLGGHYEEFRKLDALASLKDLPTFGLLDADLKDPDGMWIGQRVIHYCIGYNTKAVKATDLPATWDDILTSPRWRGGKLALVNRPDNWLVHLWGAKGEAWGRKFTTRLFLDVKPQLRKENNLAAMSLAVAGEFDMVIQTQPHRVKQLAEKGAPAGCWYPDVVPTSVSDIAILKASPHIHGAKLFVNWLVSHEGQLAQYKEIHFTPLYVDQQERGFIPIPVPKGRRVVYDTKAVQDKYQEMLSELWDNLWFKGQGLKIMTVSAKLDAVKRGGRAIQFKVKGEAQTAKVSGSRTQVTVDGEFADRSLLKSGYTCKIVYTGNNQEAQKINCRK